MRDVVTGNSNEDQNSGQFHEHDGGIEIRRLFNADHQNRGDHQDTQKRYQIEYGGNVRQSVPVNSRFRKGLLNRVQRHPFALI